mmetsp:Transcript_35215/g.105191  ORF Transcript_35215/g.105191 Transcript_35215/m.105191 type:complete len:212 (+) Transcript_35215:461-1096(+)
MNRRVERTSSQKLSSSTSGLVEVYWRSTWSGRRRMGTISGKASYSNASTVRTEAPPLSASVGRPWTVLSLCPPSGDLALDQRRADRASIMGPATLRSTEARKTWPVEVFIASPRPTGPPWWESSLRRPTAHVLRVKDMPWSNSSSARVARVERREEVMEEEEPSGSEYPPTMCTSTSMRGTSASRGSSSVFFSSSSSLPPMPALLAAMTER